MAEIMSIHKKRDSHHVIRYSSPNSLLFPNSVPMHCIRVESERTFLIQSTSFRHNIMLRAQNMEQHANTSIQK